MPPETPIDAADLLWALAGLAGAHRVSFDARSTLHQFPPPLNLATLSHASAALGIRLAQRSIPPRDLGQASFPLVALRRDGDTARLAIVLSADSKAVLLAERETQPHELSPADFGARYGTDVLLASAEEQKADSEPALTDRPFGLSWFIPELLRHKAVWREVLLASLCSSSWRWRCRCAHRR